MNSRIIILNHEIKSRIFIEQYNLYIKFKIILKNLKIYNIREYGISEDEESKQIKIKNHFKNRKSIFILKKIFNIIIKNKLLDIMKYNKKLQKRLNLSINDYKEYSEIFSSIEIEIIPMKEHKYSQFINIFKGYEKYYHIYFNK